MKTILFVVWMILSLSIKAKVSNPYLTLKFDKVMMYDFSGSKDRNKYIVNANGQLATSITKHTQLDIESIKNLNTHLGIKSSYGGGKAACFDPHLGFVYYLKGKIVAYITICLDCNVLVSSLPLDAQKQGKVGEGKDTYYIADAPSKKFRTFLNDLLKNYNFSHQIRN
jgi:hypothetical protein